MKAIILGLVTTIVLSAQELNALTNEWGDTLDVSVNMEYETDEYTVTYDFHSDRLYLSVLSYFTLDSARLYYRVGGVQKYIQGTLLASDLGVTLMSFEGREYEEFVKDCNAFTEMKVGLPWEFGSLRVHRLDLTMFTEVYNQMLSQKE